MPNEREEIERRLVALERRLDKLQNQCDDLHATLKVVLDMLERLPERFASSPRR